MSEPTTSLRNPTELEGKEIKLILTKGKKLFEKMRLTPEAKQWLKDNPDLAEVIDKW
jgi:hypothetical protein